VAGASNVHWRNNLMLGENSAPAILAVTTYTSYTSSDYNGFRPNAAAESSFTWNAPARGAVADFPGPNHTPAMDARQFKTLAEYSQATGQDKNSVLVDYDIFTNVPRLDAQKADTVQKLYRAEDFDFRLKAGAVAVDKGLALPNVTDGFAGRAPDLGALEVGQRPVQYGPRTQATTRSSAGR
jgi:hypothetical protein